MQTGLTLQITLILGCPRKESSSWEKEYELSGKEDPLAKDGFTVLSEQTVPSGINDTNFRSDEVKVELREPYSRSIRIVQGYGIRRVDDEFYKMIELVTGHTVYVPIYGQTTKPNRVSTRAGIRTSPYDYESELQHYRAGWAPLDYSAIQMRLTAGIERLENSHSMLAGVLKRIKHRNLIYQLKGLMGILVDFKSTKEKSEALAFYGFNPIEREAILIGGVVGHIDRNATDAFPVRALVEEAKAKKLWIYVKDSRSWYSPSEYYDFQAKTYKEKRYIWRPEASFAR